MYLSICELTNIGIFPLFSYNSAMNIYKLLFFMVALKIEEES